MKNFTFVLDAGWEKYYTEKEQNIAKLSEMLRGSPLSGKKGSYGICLSGKRSEIGNKCP